MSKKKELWVCGFPSTLGGADTELDHNIDLWTQCGVDVHLMPVNPPDNPVMVKKCEDRGCTIHKWEPSLFKGKVVVGFCTKLFLESLETIHNYGKPALVIWFNCMTWPFDEEKKAIENGWIDLHGFVSSYQESLLRPKQEKIGKIESLEGYKPYYHISHEPIPKIRNGHYSMGRLSRPDPSKFSDDMWRIFMKVCSPVPTKTFIMGWDDKIQERCGKAPEGLDWMVISPNAKTQEEFYALLHVLIHKTGGSKESYGRIVPECYEFGVVPIVEKNYAFPDIVIEGETGFMCDSSDEMSYVASALAFDDSKRKAVVKAGRSFLENEISNKEKCWKAWKAVL